MTPSPPAAPEPWPSDWIRGTLSLCLLRVLADGPTYGYALAVRLAEAGLGDLKGGTLYPALARHEQAGHVTVDWRAGDGGPGRKYYTLTDSGRAALAEGAARWRRFTSLTTDLLAGAPGAPVAPPEGTTRIPSPTRTPTRTGTRTGTRSETPTERTHP